MRLRKILPGFSAGVLLALLLVFGLWPVLADAALQAPSASPPRQVSADPDPSSPVFVDDTAFYVPAAAFGPDGVNPTSYRFVFQSGPILSGGGGYMVGTASAHGCMQAPVYLPVSAIIREMSAYVYDNDSSQQVIVTLYRVNKNNGVQENMGSVATSVAGATPGMLELKNTSLSVPQVDNTNYNYYLNTCMRSINTAFWGVALRFATNDLGISLVTQPYVLFPGTTNFRYVVTVSNLGSNPGTGITFNTILPAQATVTGFAGPSCVQVASAITCTPAAALNPGATLTLNVDLSLPSGFSGALTAQSTVSSVSADENFANNIATLISVVGPPLYYPAVIQDLPFP
jgi:hypothetical protein